MDFIRRNFGDWLGSKIITDLSWLYGAHNTGASSGTNGG
jgi:hypothetical protein